MTPYVLIVIALAVFSQAQFQTFLTRPGQTSLMLNVTPIDRPANLFPGYIFVVEYSDANAAFPSSPQIFQSDGTLIWDGYQTVEKRAWDLHVCDYLGGLGNHLCYNDALPIKQPGFSSGTVKIYDNTYTEVGGDLGATNGLIGADHHELNTPAGYNGHSLLQDVYKTVPTNLTEFGGPSAGYAISGCFQDLDVASRKVMFQWCSLDHVPIAETNVPLVPPGNTIIGTGELHSPYDYFHINSVDKDGNGDYLVSSRHCDAVYKIAGLKHSKPGSIIWHLGGKCNSFAFQGKWNFSRQHAARFQGTKGSITTISLFNNAYDGGTLPSSTTATASSGMIIAVDEAKMTASLTQKIIHPNGLLADREGNVQLLPNGNRFIGWGDIAAFSEHDPQGNLIYYASFSGDSYRVWKFPFTAHPATRPDILAYARFCNSPLVIYVSWNGATEVVAWRFHTSNSTDGPFTEVGTYPKIGYETHRDLAEGSFAPYVYAEALDSNSKILNSTLVFKTFVPGIMLAESCNSTQCPPGTNYTLINSDPSC